jgi:hypothetical protein
MDDSPWVIMLGTSRVDSKAEIIQSPPKGCDDRRISNLDIFRIESLKRVSVNRQVLKVKAISKATGMHPSECCTDKRCQMSKSTQDRMVSRGFDRYIAWRPYKWNITRCSSLFETQCEAHAGVALAMQSRIQHKCCIKSVIADCSMNVTGPWIVPSRDLASRCRVLDHQWWHRILYSTKILIHKTDWVNMGNCPTFETVLNLFFLSSVGFARRTWALVIVSQAQTRKWRNQQVSQTWHKSVNKWTKEYMVKQRGDDIDQSMLGCVI